MSFDLNALLADLELRHPPRTRHVRLRIVPPGRVRVSAPRGFRRSELPELLRRHAPWLHEQLSVARARHRESLSIPESLELLACAERHTLDVRSGAARGVCRQGASGLRLDYAQGLEWREPLRRWLNRKARAVLEPWLDTLSARTGLDYARLGIRAQRSRWGSCSAAGTISLNRNLLFLPPRQVEYLLLHELCHTREMNHSARYWALVAEHMPEYRQHDRGLREAMQKVPAWALPD